MYKLLLKLKEKDYGEKNLFKVMQTLNSKILRNLSTLKTFLRGKGSKIQFVIFGVNHAIN